MPAIQVGQSEGRMLNVLARLVGATKIVEVGTLAGYSAIQLATALPATGHLWTIEFEAKHAAVARANIAAAGLAARVTVEVGAGRDVLPTLDAHGPFDLVFIDADKVKLRSLRPVGTRAPAQRRPRDRRQRLLLRQAARR